MEHEDLTAQIIRLSKPTVKRDYESVISEIYKTGKISQLTNREMLSSRIRTRQDTKHLTSREQAGTAL